MDDEFDMPVFAFHDLDYVPWGIQGVLAPYIETPASTMRAAATLMGLDIDHLAFPTATTATKPRTIVCDLGCGDGDFLVGLLAHLNTNSTSFVHGVGVDYDSALIDAAGLRSDSAGESVQWIIYDFNLDSLDLATQLLTIYKITHLFIYLLPKQLKLPTVERLLTRLCKSGVVVCCHKFQPAYLPLVREDLVMDLAVYSNS